MREPRLGAGRQPRAHGLGRLLDGLLLGLLDRARLRRRARRPGHRTGRGQRKRQHSGAQRRDTDATWRHSSHGLLRPPPAANTTAALWQAAPIALAAHPALPRKRQVQTAVAPAVVAGLSVGAPLAIVLMVQRETGSFA